MCVCYVRKINVTSKTGISCGALLTLWAVSEVSAIAQSPRWAGIGRRVGFGGTGGTHKPVTIQADWSKWEINREVHIVNKACGWEESEAVTHPCMQSTSGALRATCVQAFPA